MMIPSQRIMSLNINGDYSGGDNSWEKRTSLNLAIIKRYKPDIIGLQEAAKINLETLRENLSEYSIVLGNCYGDTPPQEYSSILYQTSRYDLLETGEFWFSETPDIESTDWGVEYPMGATWVKLKCKKTDKKLFHLNTHFEDGPWGEQSRVNANKLIISRIAQISSNQPVVVTGDFNCNPWSIPYQMFHDNGYKDSYRVAGNSDSVESSTLHVYEGNDYFALDYGSETFWRVDWILTLDGDQKVQTISSTIVRDAIPPTYPVDHYPIISEIKIL
jgi:endonuclease/exonuclease/phosphatase family metal-dependent hydrolase